MTGGFGVMWRGLGGNSKNEIVVKKPLFGSWSEQIRNGHYQKPSDEELREKLSQMAYQITQNNGTEPAYRNEYWDNHEAGIYVDLISGEPLFSSTDKFDSGTGWPSFSKPLSQEYVVEEKDLSLGVERVEIKSKLSQSHLGHVFEDGPEELGGLRYCINSAALRFVSVEELKDQGYGQYLSLFERED